MIIVDGAIRNCYSCPKYKHVCGTYNVGNCEKQKLEIRNWRLEGECKKIAEKQKEKLRGEQQ